MIKRCALYLYEKGDIQDILAFRHPAIIWNNSEIRNWLHNVAGFLAAYRDDKHPLEDITIIIEEDKNMEFLTGKEFLNGFSEICKRAGCEGFNVPSRDKDDIGEVRLSGSSRCGSGEAGGANQETGI